MPAFRERLLATLRAVEPVLAIPGVLVAGSQLPNLMEPGAASTLVVSQDVDVLVPVELHAQVRDRLAALTDLVPSPEEPSVWVPRPGDGLRIEVNFIGKDASIVDPIDTYELEDERLPLMVFGPLSLLEAGPVVEIDGLRIPLPRPAGATLEKLFLDTSPDLDMMGAVAYGRDGLVMRYVMKGFDVAQLERCAARAGFTVRVDPDRAYAAIDMTGPLGTITAGYLALADGALLTRTVTQLPPTTLVPPPTTRADLEADVAAAARENATADATLVAELGRVDRRHAMWYVGDATGTPLADKVGRVRGWVDLDRGLAFELSVEVVDRAMADEIARGIPELKRQAGALGKEVGDVVRGLRFERKGDRLRFGLTISDRQLEALLDQMAPFMGGAGGMP